VDAMPLVNMGELNSILDKFIAIGYVVGVISWSAMHGTKEYNKETRKAKKAWIKNNLPCVSEFHVVKYGTNKHTVAKIRGSILVDDNAQVRKAWEKYTEENFTIDASDTANLLKNLEKVLAMAA
jgi:5'(3')-deoxyribonucleotidase